jgi:hypothetical protein
VHHQRLKKLAIVDVFQRIHIQPMKKRNIMNWLKLVETAAAIVKTMNKTLQPWYSGNLPYISDNGAITEQC